MPNKKTLAHNDTFHFYHEWLDEYQVHLELGAVYKRGSYRRIIPIPIHIWEVIRKIDLPDPLLIDKSDKKLLVDVKIDFDEQMLRHEQYRPFFNRITRFYQDERDEHNVYLASEHATLEGNYESTVGVPIDIWEVIRKIDLPNPLLIDKNDEELLIEIKKYDVNGAIGYEQDPPLSEEMIESLKYMKNKFRPEQIRLAMEEHKALRTEQQSKKANDRIEVSFLQKFPPEIAKKNAQQLADYMTDSFNNRIKRRDLGVTPWVMKKQQRSISDQEEKTNLDGGL